MNIDVLPTVDHAGLHDLLLSMGTTQTLMVWGPPGIGKSQTIEAFGRELGMPVSILLGSQMSPEDLSVPLIDQTTYLTRMCPPATLIRDVPSIVFLDELNGAEPDVMRGFFSLVNERRIGDHHLRPGSVVVCAGNPTTHNSVARPIPAPLMSRMYHVHLKITSTRGWLDWAHAHEIHPLITEYIGEAGVRALLGQPADDDQIATNPRAWAIASNALAGWSAAIAPLEGTPEYARRVTAILKGAVNVQDAEKFGSFLTRRVQDVSLSAILSGTQKLPDPEQDRALVSHLIGLLRTRLAGELPRLEGELRAESQHLTDGAVRLLQQLAQQAPELGAALLADEKIPAWFLERLQTRLSAVLN
ncbi:AAA family ATPase [Deinococcus yunweiensis]|uniref:AAA family ATPase n=1 Tax=Deinococcus yunweiensis TaxID=367282 RepID=UPI00398ED8F8